MSGASKAGREPAPRLFAVELSPRRARELAPEAERLGRAVMEAARDLEFDDEPSRFHALLSKAGAKGRAGRR